MLKKSRPLVRRTLNQQKSDINEQSSLKVGGTIAEGDLESVADSVENYLIQRQFRETVYHRNMSQ